MVQLDMVVQPLRVRSLRIGSNTELDRRIVVTLLSRTKGLEELRIAYDNNAKVSCEDVPDVISTISDLPLRRLFLNLLDLSPQDISSLPQTLELLALDLCTAEEQSSQPTVTNLEMNDIGISPLLDGLSTGDWPSLKSIYCNRLREESEVDVSFKAACKLRGIKVFDFHSRDPIALS